MVVGFQFKNAQWRGLLLRVLNYGYHFVEQICYSIEHSYYMYMYMYAASS